MQCVSPGFQTDRVISFLKVSFAQSWFASRLLFVFEAFGLAGIVHQCYKYECMISVELKGEKKVI